MERLAFDKRTLTLGADTTVTIGKEGPQDASDTTCCAECAATSSGYGQPVPVATKPPNTLMKINVRRVDCGSLCYTVDN